jgi:hypothetical protein
MHQIADVPQPKFAEPDSPDNTCYAYQFDDWNRPDVPYWFSLTAVAADGTQSAQSEAISFNLPAGKRKSKTEPATLHEFKAKKAVPGD